MRQINLQVYEVSLYSHEKQIKFDQKFYFGCWFEMGCYSEYHDFLQPMDFYIKNSVKFFKRYDRSEYQDQEFLSGVWNSLRGDLKQFTATIRVIKSDPNERDASIWDDEIDINKDVQIAYLKAVNVPYGGDM